MPISCDPNDLAIEAACFSGLSERGLLAATVVTLCNLVNGDPVSCDPNQLSIDAACFNGIPTKKLMEIQLSLLCQLNIAGLPPGGNEGDLLVKNSATDFDAIWVPPGTAVAQVIEIPFVIDNLGSVIGAGVAGDFPIEFDMEVTGVSLLADQVGDIVVDLWKDTFGAYPPTVADSVCAAAKPTIAANDTYQDTTLTGWTTTWLAGQTIRVNVDSAATITRCTLTIKANRI